MGSEPSESSSERTMGSEPSESSSERTMWLGADVSATKHPTTR